MPSCTTTISNMAIYRLKKGECTLDPELEDCLLQDAKLRSWHEHRRKYVQLCLAS